ncbi:MAG: PAS domain-containing protein, partial [Clostridia bacterium]|nr:PAS domain-containing protein [Clostridia bacterium]
MKIRSKILLIIGITVTAIVLLNGVTLRCLVANYIEKEELSAIHQNYDRALSMIHREEETLSSSVLDWAEWDDTYKYMIDRNSAYSSVNLQEGTLDTLKLNVLSYFDAQGNVIVLKTKNLNGITENELEKEMISKLNIKTNFKTMTEKEEPCTGILMISGKPFLFSLAPITTSDGTAPANGILIMGRVLGDTFTKYMQDVLQIKIKLTPSTSEVYTMLKANYKLNTHGDRSFWIYQQPNRTIIYSTTADILGNYSFYVVYEMNRQLYRNGIAAIDYFAAYFCFALIVVMFICLIGIERIVTAPVKKLHTFMRTVGARKDTKARITLRGSDEIADLAVITNEVLEELDSSYSEMKIREERFKLIMEATNDGYFDFNLARHELYISPMWLSSLGYKSDERFQGLDQYVETLHPDDREGCKQLMKQCLKGHTERFRIEYRTRKKSGEWLWILVRGKIVEFDASHKPVRVIGTL